MQTIKLNPIASNMTELQTPEYTILFSYKTPVACIDNLSGFRYRTEKKWSVTTSRHINKWFENSLAQSKPQEFFDNLI